MTCLTLIPLLVAAFTALAAALIVLQRTSLAQSVCVQSASRLSADLGRRLDQLLRLNVRARALRRQRRAAEHARRVAIEALNPVAVTLAEAHLTAVTLAQIALDGEQRAILTSAFVARRHAQAEFRIRVNRLRAARVSVGPNLGPALAVRAEPPSELAPEYVTVDQFAIRQRQSFAFDVVLAPDFARALIPRSTQRTSCVTTLKRKDTRWRNSIVAASARSSSR